MPGNAEEKDGGLEVTQLEGEAPDMPGILFPARRRKFPESKNTVRPGRSFFL